MKQIILKNCKYVTLDKKIPTMKAMLITGDKITASADDFILKDLAPDAEVYDLGGRTVIPAFTDAYGDFLGRARSISKNKNIDIFEAIKELSLEYLTLGTATIAAKNITEADYIILKEADEKGFLLIDVAIYVTEGTKGIIPEKMPVDTEYVGHLRPAGFSVYVDELVDLVSLSSICCDHIRKHQQIAFTANTKKAVDTCIDAYRAALCEVNGTKTDEDGNEKPKIFEDLRPLICGVKELDPSRLTLLQSLGFVPCFSHDRILQTPDAASTDYPIRDIVRRGMAFALTHDNSDNLSAIGSLHIAVNRTGDNGIIGEDQTINSDQALMALSLYSSYALFEDLYKGSLTMSKKADLVILSDNPLEISDASLQKIEVYMTIIDGRIFK